MEQMPSKNRLISGKGIVIAVVIFFTLMICVPVFIMRWTMSQAVREYTVFGKRETEVVKSDMGITLSNQMTARKLTVSHAGGDFSFQIWIEDIEDPEKFMKESFDGTYKETELSSNDLQYAVLAYDDGGDPSAADKVYDCEYYINVDGKDIKHFDKYRFAFYKSGDTYKLKAVGSKI